LVIECVVECGNPTNSTKAERRLWSARSKALDTKSEQVVFGGSSARVTTWTRSRSSAVEMSSSRGPGAASKEMIKRARLYERLRLLRRYLGKVGQPRLREAASRGTQTLNPCNAARP